MTWLRSSRRVISGAAALLLAVAVLVPAVGAAENDEGQAPVIRAAERPVPGQYIVVLKSGGDPRSVVAIAGVGPRYVYTTALNGFAATLNAGQLTALRHNRNVDYIEEDQEVSTDTTQSPVTWGLDRIDQRNRPLDNSYTYTGTGAGVTAYIIDTGILLSHSEFGGRAATGYDAVTSGGSAVDCNGHGTHVAGTVGGTTYGMAKSVSLVAVRVLNCSGSGTWAQVIAGVDWVTSHAAKPAVANMSLGGGASTAVDTAVTNSINAGISYAVAAGNGNFIGIAQDACKSSPARVPAAMTISATDNTDKKAFWANYGNCVDWFAPGVNITSAWIGSSTATNTISGTSMATPHTTGAAARYLEGHPTASSQTVRDALFNSATSGVVTSSKTTNPRLLYMDPLS